MKVDAPMERDFWLDREAVLSFTTERVTLAFNHDRLAAHKVEAPDES